MRGDKHLSRRVVPNGVALIGWGAWITGMIESVYSQSS